MTADPAEPLEPYYTDDRVTLYHGDCIDVLRSLPAESIHAVVTDPPYGLEFMGKDWDAFGTGKGGASVLSPEDDKWNNAYSKARVTFHTGRASMVAFGAWCEEWLVECHRVLKPGGHLLAFGGSRTWHRLACAAEDAGFELRDSIAWLYGSGFPKNMDVGRAIDGLDAADERRRRSLAFTEWMRSTGVTSAELNRVTDSNMGGHYLTDREQPCVPTPEHFARILSLFAPEEPTPPEWVHELVLERAVESENIAAREVIGEHDTAAAGATWRANNGIDADLTTGKPITAPLTDEAKAWAGWGTALKPAFEPIVVGRKPFKGTIARNVLEHGTSALNIDATRTPTDEVRVQGTQTKPGATSMQPNPREGGRVYDKGRWPTNVVLDSSQAEQLDRETGFSVSPPVGSTAKVKAQKSGSMAGGFEDHEHPKGHGDAGGPSRFFPTFHYEPKAPTHERPRDEDGTVHPTVKPLDLMRWLVRLVTPPGGTVLEPFGGSGTTAEACVVEGFQCTIIERSDEYLPLIVRRLTKPIQVALDFGGDE